MTILKSTWEDESVREYAALIIAYRRPDLVQDVLRQLEMQDEIPSRVIVVDNGGDLAVDYASESALQSRVKTITRGDNPGYAVAVNLAREVARGEGLQRLLVLTHDARFGPSLVRNLLDALESDDAIGAAAPVLYRASDPQRVFSSGGTLGRGGRAWHRTDVPREMREVDWVDGAIVMYSVGALDAIGGIDERYFLYFEDVDTAWSMRQRGLRTVVVPTEGAQEPGAHPTYLGVRNMTLFAKKAGLPAIAAGGAVLRRVAEDAIVDVLAGRSPRWSEAWRGWRDGRRDQRGKPGD